MKKAFILILVLILTMTMVGISGCSNSPTSEELLSESSETAGVEGEELLSESPETSEVEEKGHNQQSEKNNGFAQQNEEVNSDLKSEPNEIKSKPFEEQSQKKKLKCTFSINCSTVFDNLDKIDKEILKVLPNDGWIYPAKEIEFKDDESVFDILLRITKQEKIHMESNSNPVLKSKYVEGINNLYEFDAGELSGWTYKVNGKGMGYGSSSSYLKDGDIVEWVYTCDQGRDVEVVP